MAEKKKELLTINLETWNEMVREDERKSIKIARLENALEVLNEELKDLFAQIKDELIDEDEIDEEATLKMWEEEQDE